MKDSRNKTRGFTLVELLVAMAVFISLMAGLAVLFTGTLNTVKGSYQLLDAYEVGRSAIDRIDADLKGAFTSREHGDYYSFYGTPFGFMYVGTLEDGELGRVTYALHPNAETQRFDTTIQESRDTIRNNVIAHGVAASAQFATDTTALAQQWADFYDGHFPTPPDGNEYSVRVVTYSMVRYEERGATDLDAFRLPGGLQWPYIDPINPNNDIIPPVESGAYSLYVELLSAINPDPALNPNYDMRTLIAEFRGGMHQPYYLRGVTSETVQEFLAARKREIWIRMIGGEQIGNMPSPWYNDATDPDTIIDTDPSFWPLNANDYVLADGILRRAILHGPDSDGLLSVSFGNGLVYAEALSVSGIFSYGDGADNYSPYFNAPMNVAGYAAWQRDAANNADAPEELLYRLDAAVVDANTRARRSEEALGSPLLPRLPALVGVDFSISREKTRPGGGDFRRKFSQFIDVPTAISGGEIRTSIPNTKS